MLWAMAGRLFAPVWFNQPKIWENLQDGAKESKARPRIAGVMAYGDVDIYVARAVVLCPILKGAKLAAAAAAPCPLLWLDWLCGTGKFGMGR